MRASLLKAPRMLFSAHGDTTRYSRPSIAAQCVCSVDMQSGWFIAFDTQTLPVRHSPHQRLARLRAQPTVKPLWSRLVYYDPARRVESQLSHPCVPHATQDAGAEPLTCHCGSALSLSLSFSQLSRGLKLLRDIVAGNDNVDTEIRLPIIRYYGLARCRLKIPIPNTVFRSFYRMNKTMEVHIDLHQSIAWMCVYYTVF